MTAPPFALATVELRVERNAGWLDRLIAGVEGAGYGLETFVLRGAHPGEQTLHLTLTMRTRATRLDTGAIVAALDGMPGVRRAPLAQVPDLDAVRMRAKASKSFRDALDTSTIRSAGSPR